MPNQNQNCRCGCGNPATFTSGGESFFKRPCRQRFYRRTIKAARNGDASAQAYIQAHGWKINANIGGAKNASAPKATPASKATPAPAAAPTPAPKLPKAPRIPRTKRAPKIPKIFSEFLATRCKSLVLAAKVLGIKPKPPLQKSIVRSAWISLVRVHHPDMGGALEAAQAVNAAYQLLEKFSQ